MFSGILLFLSDFYRQKQIVCNKAIDINRINRRITGYRKKLFKLIGVIDKNTVDKLDKVTYNVV